VVLLRDEPTSFPKGGLFKFLFKSTFSTFIAIFQDEIEGSEYFDDPKSLDDNAEKRVDMNDGVSVINFAVA
jgi:hypothetical protein